jgi:hypothetical protein
LFTAAVLLGSLLVGSTAFGQAVRSGNTFDISAGGWGRFTDVAWDPTNRVYLVVWGAFGTVRGRFVSADGTPLGPAPFDVDATTAYANTPAVTYDADDGVFMVVWQDNRINDQIPVIFGRALSYQSSGIPTFRGPDFRLSEFVFSTSPPSVAYSPSSREFLVVYHAGVNDIRGLRYTVDGVLLGGGIAVSSTAEYESRPAVTWNSAADEFYVVYPYWIDAVNQGGVKGQRVKAGTGVLLGGAFEIDPLAAGQNGPVDVAYDPANNRYFVAFYRSIPSGYVTLGRIVDAANTSGASRFTIANTGTYVSLGMDRNPSTGSFFTAFGHHDKLELYGAEATEGGVSTGMFRVTDTGQEPALPGQLGSDYARVAAASDRPEWLVTGVKLNFPTIGQRIQAGSSSPTFSKATPANGATTQPNALTLTWGMMPGASYEVCVDTVNNNACDTTWQVAGYATTLGLSGLADGTYYWQVRANAGGVITNANYEAWWSFAVGAAPPALFSKLAPTDGMTGLTSTVTLTWSAAAGATGYQLCVDTVRDGSCTTQWVSVGLVTSSALTGQPNGTRYWQVRALIGSPPYPLADNGVEYGFTVGGTPPATFGKVSPANNATGLGSSVTATWATMAGATEYQGCLDTVNDGNCNTSWQSAGTSTSWGLANLANGTYYWQVRALTTSGWVLADSGVEWKFTVGGTTSPTFGKLAPGNGTSGLGSAVTLTWSALTDAGYYVCWDTTNNNTCDGTWWPNGGSTARALTGLANGTYYWQVRAQTASGTTEGDNSTWWSFTVGAAPPPAAFGKTTPANGATGLASAVTLTWGSASGATAYQVCLDTTNDNACSTTWQSAGSATTLAQSGLVNGVYYWQVRAQNAAGTTDADGGTWWSFRVGPVPPTFAKTSPADSTSGLGSSVTLTWSPLTDAGYSVCWDTTNNNTCDGAWWPNGGAAARTLTGLANGTYYWQVRAQTASGTSEGDGGTWWSFTVGGSQPPLTFAKASPANGATGLGSALTLAWGSSTGATGYQVCVDALNDGTCNTAWQSAGTATSWGLASLGDGTYYWQVRAQNAGGTTDADAGTWWAFTVASAQLPAAFGKASPANGATGGQGSAVTLAWAASSGVTGYQVCVDATNDNSCNTTWQSVGTVTSFGLSGLANGLYYWQVRAQNASGTTEADGGSWWSFRMGVAPPPFNKVSPAGGTSGLGSAVTLTWLALTDAGYWVCWDTTNNNTCDGTWWPNGAGTARALSGLANGTYYWQVRAQTASGTFEGDSGTWWSFTVGGTQPPTAFGKVSPASGATGLGSALTLAWGSANGATGYQVCVDTTNDNACGATWQSAGTANSYGLSGLAGGTYYWQVRAQDAAGTTDADGGTWWVFTVASTAPPAAFGKTSPATGATGQGGTLTLAWGSSTGATGYQVCVDAINDNACSSTWQSAGTVTSYGLSGLAAGTYYWQVRAQNASGTAEADGGTFWAFTVAATGQTFDKTSPASGASGLGSSVTLTWSASTDAGYWVCWDTTNNNTCDGVWWPNGAGTARALSGLANGTYYWQVRAQTASGTFEGDSGAWWAFTVGGTQQPPSAFGKSLPASGTTGLGSAVTLAWGSSTGATGYDVCVDTTDDGACGSTWQSAGAAASFGLNGLAAGTYYWQVRAENASGTTYADAGTWWSFSVSSTPALFGKLAPVNGAAGLGSSVTLTWSAVADAGYWVCWDTTNDNTCDGAWWPNGGVSARALAGLPAGTYYWQVRAQRSSGTVGADNGMWWTFTVR